MTTIEVAAPRHQAGPRGWLMEDSLAGMARRRALLGYLFLLPTLLGILVFSAGPVIVSLGLSFFEWNVFDPPAFLGVDNYTRFFSDNRILVGFSNTAKMVSLAVIIEMVLAFGLALGVQRTTRSALRYFFRSAYFLPLLTSAATISIVMAYMFHSQFGVINYYLGLVGVPRIPWLEQAQWALLSVVLVYVWHRLGFTFIVFSGGLGNLPKEVLEAADVDGATGWRRLWYIVLPMLSPSILFAAVTASIIILAPVVWTLSTSLRTPAESFSVPPQWIPLRPDFRNYFDVFLRVPFATYVVNSFIVTGAIVLGQLVTASLAGYAFARLNFPFRDVLFWLLMATVMVPLQATLIPVFVLISSLGLDD